MKRYYVLTGLALVAIFVSTFMLFDSLDKRVREGERRITVVEQIQGEQEKTIHTLERQTQRVIREVGESSTLRGEDGAPGEPGKRGDRGPRSTPNPVPTPPTAPEAPEIGDPAPGVDNPLEEDPCENRKYRRRHRRECRQQDDDLLHTVSNVLEAAIV